ncbi:MAG: hypothetical protein CMH56_17325 [Myxococcales bacterium]|nr:hypothetical protein [Myxococcales bacterium]
MGAVLCTFIFFAPYHHRLNNPNEGVRIFMVKAMVDHDQYHIDPVVKQWKYINDKSKRDGKLYSSKAPLMSMMGAIVYEVYRWFGAPLDEQSLTLLCRRWANALPCFLLLLLLAWLLDKTTHDRRLTDFIILCLATGTHLLAYVHVFSGHTLAALGTGVMMLLLLNASNSNSIWRDSVLVGACGTASVAAEYPAFLAVLPLAVGFLFHHRKQLLKSLCGCVVGALPFALLAGWAHHQMFGAFWKTGYSFLENKNFNRMHSQDFFGIGIPQPDILMKALFSTDVGLFFFCPLALLGVMALGRWFFQKGKRVNALFISAAMLGMLFFISGHRGWRGGWVIGPRYISEMTCMLVLLAGLFLHEQNAFRKGESKLLTFALLCSVIGVLHSGIGGAFFPHFSETYNNPVYEMMIPMALTGFSPDSWALGWGLPPKAAAWTGLGILFAPLLIWLAQNQFFWGKRPLLVVMIGLWGAMLVGPMLPDTKAQNFSLETRKMYRIWEPPTGRPLNFSASQTDLAAQMSLGESKKYIKQLNQVCRSKQGGAQ